MKRAASEPGLTVKALALTQTGRGLSDRTVISRANMNV